MFIVFLIDLVNDLVVIFGNVINDVFINDLYKIEVFFYFYGILIEIN